VARAMSTVGDVAIAFSKNSKLDRVDPQNAVAALRELAALAHHDLVPRFTYVILAPSFAFAAAVPHLKIEEVEVGRAHDRADRGHRLGCVHGPVAERRKLPLTVFRFGGIKLDRGREHALQAF